MRRAAIVLLVLVTACNGQVAAEPEPETVPPSTAPPESVATATTTRLQSTTTTTEAVPEPDTSFVVWTRNGLPNDFSEIALGVHGVSGVTLSTSGTFHIEETRNAAGSVIDRPPDGFVIPVEGLVLERNTFTEFVDPVTVEVLNSLRPDEVILGSTSAEIRGQVPGDIIVFEGGIEMTVAAIVPDSAIGSAEVVVVGQALTLVPRSERRWALVDFDGSEKSLVLALEKAVPGNDVLRVRSRSGPGSHRNAVRPVVFMKKVFGEFSYKSRGGGKFFVDPQWRAENIVSVWIPLLGPTNCHRIFADLLTEVMQSLIDDGLRNVIDPTDFAGCWVPRYIGGTTRLSRHSFGAAADINFGNPLHGGPGSPVNPELLARMDAVGILSGDTWTVPDPGHFEYYGLDDQVGIPREPEFQGD